MQSFQAYKLFTQLVWEKLVNGNRIRSTHNWILCIKVMHRSLNEVKTSRSIALHILGHAAWKGWKNETAFTRTEVATKINKLPRNQTTVHASLTVLLFSTALFPPPAYLSAARYMYFRFQRQRRARLKPNIFVVLRAKWKFIVFYIEFAESSEGRKDWAFSAFSNVVLYDAKSTGSPAY